MRINRHARSDRLLVAQMIGAAGHHGRGPGWEQRVDQGAAEVRAISTDPHLLAHALAGDTDPATGSPGMRAVLLGAGADLGEAEQIWAEQQRHPGFNLGRLADRG